MVTKSGMRRPNLLRLLFENAPLRRGFLRVIRLNLLRYMSTQINERKSKRSAQLRTFSKIKLAAIGAAMFGAVVQIPRHAAP